MQTEICCFSLESARIADELKADRIELCSGFLEGGTTPSSGLLKGALDEVRHSAVFVMIRPRGGDFIYNADEEATIKNDIEELKKLTPSGFVFGALTVENEVDGVLCRKVMEWTHPYPVTFHRAFDLCMEPEKALIQIIDLGFERILTSGQEASAEKGLPLLKKINELAAGRIQIMAGAGVNSGNLQLFKNAGLPAVHFTGKEWQDSKMKNSPKIDMASGNPPDCWGKYETSKTNAEEIIRKINTP